MLGQQQLGCRYIRADRSLVHKTKKSSRRHKTLALLFGNWSPKIKLPEVKMWTVLWFLFTNDVESFLFFKFCNDDLRARNSHLLWTGVCKDGRLPSPVCPVQPGKQVHAKVEDIECRYCGHPHLIRSWIWHLEGSSEIFDSVGTLAIQLLHSIWFSTFKRTVKIRSALSLLVRQEIKASRTASLSACRTTSHREISSLQTLSAHSSAKNSHSNIIVLRPLLLMSPNNFESNCS